MTGTVIILKTNINIKESEKEKRPAVIDGFGSVLDLENAAIWRESGD